MAKFIYRMQNILDIKYKLEESARQEYAEARIKLNIEEEKLQALRERRQNYYEAYQEAIQGTLDILQIDECANAVDIMDMMIAEQVEVVKQKSKELERARMKLNEVMQERKMHEKLKEKKFEEFLEELKAEESKEIDQTVSFQYNNKVSDTEE